MQEFSKIGLTLREIFRYLLSGAAVAIAVRVAFPANVGWILKDWQLSDPALALVVMGLGAMWYGLYWPTIGRQILFRFGEWLHRHCSIRRRRSRGSVAYSCKADLLVTRYGVSPVDTYAAFAFLRDSQKFGSRIREGLHHQHSEVHLMYMAGLAFVLIPLCRFLLPFREPFLDWTSITVTMAVGVSAILSGIVADFVICRRECHELQRMGHASLHDSIQKAGLPLARADEPERDQPKVERSATFMVRPIPAACWLTGSVAVGAATVRFCPVGCLCALVLCVAALPFVLRRTQR